MDRLIGAWDGAAETAIRNRHLDEPTQTMHEYIEAEKDKCWQALARNAGHTFTDREMSSTRQRMSCSKGLQRWPQTVVNTAQSDRLLRHLAGPRMRGWRQK